MRVTETDLPGVLVIEPEVFGDERGWFLETWRDERYAAHGLPATFVQDSLSFSRRGALRGLHLQHPRGQGKLVYALAGEVFDVAVDVRPDSPHFGRHAATRLSGENKKQVWIPPGFAHGFLVTSETALFAYKCTERYAPEHELAVAWNDSDLAIAWPDVGEPRLSDKDAAAPPLAKIEKSRLPNVHSNP